MTARAAGIPALDTTTVAAQPRSLASTERYASAGRRVLTSILYTLAVVFVTGIFLGLLMGANNARADDGGSSGGDSGSASSNASTSSGGDSSSSMGGGVSSSSASAAGDSASSASTGGVSSSSASAVGDSSSSAGIGGEASAATTGGASPNGDNASASVASVSDGSAESQAAEGGYAQAGSDADNASNTDNAAAVTAQQGEAATADQAPAGPADQSDATQAVATEAPSEPSAVAASPEATQQDPGGYYSPGDPAADNADNAAEDSAVASAQQANEEDPGGYYSPGDPAVDNAVDEAAEAPTGRQYVVGFDIAPNGEGFGVRVGFQTDPPALVGMVRAWAGLGFQAYALSLPPTKPGKESVTLFGQAQYGKGPLLGGAEVALPPFKSEQDQWSVTPYAAAQFPAENTKVGNAWAVGLQEHNPVTGAKGELEGARGWGIGGMNGVAVGARGALGVEGGFNQVPAGMPDLSGLLH
jgi:hypothetical protein